MTEWRVGSKTKVTLFKGDELYGMMLTPEKAAVVVRWLNWAAMGVSLEPWEDVPDEAVVELFDALSEEMSRRGLEAGRGETEGGAEGDPAAAGEAGVRGGDSAVGTRHGGDCPPWCNGGEGR